MNLEEVKACIPHRDPFLWIDEVVEYDETSLVARKKLNEDLPVFQGHYPDFPILPGVIQCEMALQASAILISKILPAKEGDTKVPVATRMNEVKFRKAVRPGQTLEIHVSITERLADTFFLAGKIMSDGKATTRLEFAVTAAELT